MAFVEGLGFGGLSFSQLHKVLLDTSYDVNLSQFMVRVYLTLGMTVFTSALGCYAFIYTNYILNQMISLIAIIGLLGFISYSKNNSDRILALAALGFVQGLSLGPLVAYALHVDPAIVLTAFLGTTVIFVSFTLAAFYANNNRSFLFLGGLLGSALGNLALLSLFNIFFRSVFLFNVQIYLGLLVFSGYILYDTQLTIYRWKSGNSDYVHAALELFLDFVAIFVRLLIILLKNRGENNGSNKSNSNNKSSSGSSTSRR